MRNWDEAIEAYQKGMESRLLTDYSPLVAGHVLHAETKSCFPPADVSTAHKLVPSGRLGAGSIKCRHEGRAGRGRGEPGRQQRRRLWRHVRPRVHGQACNGPRHAWLPATARLQGHDPSEQAAIGRTDLQTCSPGFCFSCPGDSTRIGDLHHVVVAQDMSANPGNMNKYLSDPRFQKALQVGHFAGASVSKQHRQPASGTQV